MYVCTHVRKNYPSMLLTAYISDTRVPLAGVLRYTEQLKKAIHTHFTMNPDSGMCTHALSHSYTQQLNHLLIL